MDNLGFIHEKLDIKILILYILRRLPYTVEPETLQELCQQCDTGIGYFDYSDCLSELVDTGHVTEDEEGYRITGKGVKNAEAVGGGLAMSDGEGEVMHLRLLCTGEDQAKQIEKSFRRRAEGIYQDIAALLTTQK